MRQATAWDVTEMEALLLQGAQEGRALPSRRGSAARLVAGEPSALSHLLLRGRYRCRPPRGRRAYRRTVRRPRPLGRWGH